MISTKKKEVKITKKVKRLLKRLGKPKFLHRFGPKTYEFAEHLACLFLKCYSRLSYRRVVSLCNLLGMRCPSKSALQYTAKKLDASFWHQVLRATSSHARILALDGTGLSRTNPSYHYLRRIDGKIPKIPIKLSAAVNVETKKFTAAQVHVLPRHDMKDALHLLKNSSFETAVADKAYDAESLYRFCEELEKLFMAPVRKGVKRGRVRKKMQLLFEQIVYNKRSLIESGFGSIKRKFGHSVSSKTVRTIRTEVYLRLACHNLFGRQW